MGNMTKEWNTLQNELKKIIDKNKPYIHDRLELKQESNVLEAVLFLMRVIEEGRG